MLRMPSSAQYCKQGVGVRRPQGRWIMGFLAQSHCSCARTSVLNFARCTRGHVTPQGQERLMRPMWGGTLPLFTPPLYSTSPPASWHPPTSFLTVQAAAPAQAPRPVSAAGPRRYPAACAVSMSGHARGKDGMARSRGQARPAGEGPDGRSRTDIAGEEAAPPCLHVFPGRRRERLRCGITEAPPRRLRGPKTRVSAGSVGGE
jgi:hypothetical protein